MLKALKEIKAVHVILILSLITIVLLFIRTKSLEASVIRSITTNDTLITYINDLRQRVYELPSVNYDPSIIKQLSKIDSNYQNLVSRFKSLNKSYKDLQASVNLSIVASDSGRITHVDSLFYIKDSITQLPIKVATFEKDDGLLRLKATTDSNLDYLDYQYDVMINKAYVDVFKAPGGTFKAVVTFDNPNVHLASQMSYVRSRPRPILSLSAGLTGGMYISESSLKIAPGIGITVGVPLYTFYK